MIFECCFDQIPGEAILLFYGLGFVGRVLSRGTEIRSRDCCVLGQRLVSIEIQLPTRSFFPPNIVVVVSAGLKSDA